MIKPQSFGNIVSISLLPWGSSEIVSQNLFHWSYVGLICRSKFFFLTDIKRISKDTAGAPLFRSKFITYFLPQGLLRRHDPDISLLFVTSELSIFIKPKDHVLMVWVILTVGAIEENRFFITCWNSVVLNINSVLFNIFLFVSQCNGNHLFAYEKDAFCTAMIVIIITSASIIVLHN